MNRTFRERVNSLPEINEIQKRKRNDLCKDFADVFKKSKKISRSPAKTEESSTKKTETPEEMEEFKKLFMEMMKEFKEEMKTSNNVIKEELKEIRQEIKKNSITIAEIEALQRNIQEKEMKWMEDKEELERKVQSLGRRLEEQERKRRSNNIIIKGLQIDEGKPKEIVKNFLRTELDINCPIRSTVVIKKFQSGSIIKVELEDITDKELVMKNKSKLKGKKVYIDSDYTPEERKMHMVIRKRANEERIKGNNIKIYYNKLIVNGKYFIWNMENGCLAEHDQTSKK